MSYDKDRERYAQCMIFVRHRINSIKDIISGRHSTSFPQTNADFLYLQFRYIFETIAMASLCSNRARYETIRKAFHKERDANKILKNLARINPNFYPKPIYLDAKASLAQGIKVVDFVEDGYLSPDDLRRGIGICGNSLHVHNVYATNSKLEYSDHLSQAKIWISEIEELLKYHIAQISEKVAFEVQFDFTNEKGIRVDELENIFRPNSGNPMSYD